MTDPSPSTMTQVEMTSLLIGSLRDLADYAADGPPSPMVIDMVSLMRRAADALEQDIDALRRSTEREVQLGVIEFHSERANPGLIKRFYAVRDDLIAAGCIVDLWLMDIATVLNEFGYTMRITTTKPIPTPGEGDTTK